MIICTIFLVCGAIIALWILFLFLHTKNSENHYRKVSIRMGVKDGVIKKDPTLNSLLKLFFYRQVTYEFSAYAILIICVFFLIGCIVLFLFANRFVLIDDTNIRLNSEQILFSIISIRVGIAVVVFFICRVLLKLYRYCLHFSSFYTGLFDAFFIQENVILNFKDAIETFMLKTQLNDDDKNPIDDVIEILKNLRVK